MVLEFCGVGRGMGVILLLESEEEWGVVLEFCGVGRGLG